MVVSLTLTTHPPQAVLQPLTDPPENGPFRHQGKTYSVKVRQILQVHPFARGVVPGKIWYIEYEETNTITAPCGSYNVYYLGI